MSDKSVPKENNSTARQVKLMRLREAAEAVSRHYLRDFKRLSFVPPAQLTDGSVGEFIDAEDGTIIATARLRLTNEFKVDSNGIITAEFMLSDLAFSRQSVDISVVINNTTTKP